MQRELHLAKEARYSEAFSTLHEERRKSRRFDDIAAGVVAMRRASHDDGDAAAGGDDIATTPQQAVWCAAVHHLTTQPRHALPRISDVVRLSDYLFYYYFCIQTSHC